MPAPVLVLLAHPAPQRSRVHRRLTQAVRALPGTAGVEVLDLHARYPDYVIDVAAEQERLARAELVVWQHPIQWYGMPALMKLWLDDVLTHGWAYGHGGRALQGKSLWLVTSTGAGEDAYRPDGYNRYFFDAFLPPYEQTAVLCGMRFLPPLVLHGAGTMDDAALDAQAGIYAQRLASYPDWPEIADMPACIACDIPSGDRPEQA